MHITFRALGLEFDSEIHYTPIIPGKFSGPPEHCYPDEGGEVEILTLTVDGNDAMFLSGSIVWEDIEDAAATQAESDLRDPDL